MIPSSKKEEFDKYNVPSGFLEQWEQEYISQLYNDFNDYIENTPNIEHLDEMNSMKLLIFFKQSTHQNYENYCKAINLFVKMHELDLFSYVIQ